MKHTIASLLLAASMAALTATPAMAVDKSDMMESYRAYQTALKGKDRAAAESHAERAWEIAEDVMGDSKTTGDLAQNYADIASNGRDQVKAYKRAFELHSAYPEDKQAEVYLDRATRYANALAMEGKSGKANKVVKDALEYAEGTAFANSTYVAELMVRQTEIAVKRGRHDDTVELARAAREAFANADDGIVTVEHFRAALYEGYGLEGNDELVDAALAYQEVMEDTEGLLPRDHPFLMRSLGRWMTMRDRLKREGQLEEAQAKGLCECWPYDKKRNETVQPITRVPPVMPSHATQSGFSIVEFDLTDDGGTDNIRILESWPPEMFDSASRKSVAKWRYNPRASEESESDRKDIITTVRYVLSDQYGNVIE